MTTQTLRVNDDYEIECEYPYRIRKLTTGRYVEVYNDDNENVYPTVTLGGETYLLHRVIAFQFKHDDKTDDKNEVDHLNRIKNDYHIDNLEWVSHSENQRNRAPYTKQANVYIDELPESAIELEEYNGFKYNRYWFDHETDDLIMYTCNRFKIVNYSISGIGYIYSICDSNDVWHTIRRKKFLTEMYKRID